MRYGTIIKYFPEKKFGFIRPDQGQDVFFHCSVLEGGEPNGGIDEGQAVKFELAPREPTSETGEGREQPAKRSAQAVVLIDKLPIATLDDADRRQKPVRHPRARQKKPTWRR